MSVLPNALTLARVALVPLFVAAFFLPEPGGPYSPILRAACSALALRNPAIANSLGFEFPQCLGMLAVENEKTIPVCKIFQRRL